ncbi:MAG: hypothetical protein NVSMB18_33730 [Acetobacteraceae bacterium]
MEFMSGVPDQDDSREAARIRAELTDMAGGTDPFVAAVRASHAPMIVTNPRLPDNPIVFANDSFLQLTGYARDEILGRNCRFLQGPETDPADVDHIRRAVQQAEPIEIEVRNHRKDGSAFWNRLRVAPVKNGDGELTYFFASQTDVSPERERLEGLQTRNAALLAELAGRMRAQQDSEARFRFAAEAGRLGVWDRDLRTDEMTGSPVYRQKFGRAADEPLTYADLQAAIHPGDRDRMRAALEAAIATAAEYDISYRVVRPDGSLAWLQARAQVVRDEAGAPLRIAGISMDVTQRRLAEQQLELSEQSLRLATEVAEIGTWDLDLTTDVLTWSDRTKAMFGISPGVLCTMADFYAGLHPEDREATSTAFASALDPAIRATYDVEYRTIGREDGVLRWVAAKGRGLFEGDRCHRALGTAIDITARKTAERRQVFLLELWERLRGLTDPGVILDAAVQALGAHLGADRVGFGQIQPDDTTVALQAGYSKGAEVLRVHFESHQQRAIRRSRMTLEAA